MKDSKNRSPVKLPFIFYIFGSFVLLFSFLIYKYNINYLECLLDFYDLVDRIDSGKEFNDVNNQYLQGNFRPVTEEVNNLPLEVIAGELPVDLSGLYLRVGPNPVYYDNNKRYHWFDGDGFIHSVRIEDGKALYGCQWIETPRYLIEKEKKRSIFFRIGELKGFLGLFKIMVLQPLIVWFLDVKAIMSGQANTAIHYYNNKIYANHEGSLPFEIQWLPNNTFKSVGYETVNGQLNFPVSGIIMIILTNAIIIVTITVIIFLQ